MHPLEIENVTLRKTLSEAIDERNAAILERDEARAEAETLRAAIDGEPWGAAVLKQQRDEAVKKLGITLEQLWATEQERDEALAEHEVLRQGAVRSAIATRDTLDRLEAVAERQREACARAAGKFSTAAADAVRAAPLVTEPDWWTGDAKP